MRRQRSANRLIDEFELFVIPIVVGGGTPYFPPDVHIDLGLVETRTFGATVYLHYRLARLEVN